MKPAWITACVVALTSAAGFAETPNEARLYLALFQPQDTSATTCATAPQAAGIRFAKAGFGEQSACNATAICGTFPQQTFMHCSGNSTCAAWDRDCTVGERGHVVCDGVTSQCQSCSFCDNCVDYGSTCMDCCRCDGATAPFCYSYCGCPC
jgi:hypothetical protein